MDAAYWALVEVLDPDAGADDVFMLHLVQEAWEALSTPVDLPPQQTPLPESRGDEPVSNGQVATHLRGSAAAWSESLFGHGCLSDVLWWVVIGALLIGLLAVGALIELAR